jgi:hypothetical protein
MLRDVLFFPKFQRTPGRILIDLLKRKKPISFNIHSDEWDETRLREGRVGLPQAAPKVL